MDKMVSYNASHRAKVHEVRERVVVERELKESGGHQQLVPGVVVGHEGVVRPVHPLLFFVHVVLQFLVPRLLDVVVHAQEVSEIVILVHVELEDFMKGLDVIHGNVVWLELKTENMI